MTNFFLVIIIFFQLIKWIIIIDIITSFLLVLGINLRFKFITNFTEPMYSKIKEYIPTSIGPLDFTPIVIFIIIGIIETIILSSNPELRNIF